MTYNYKEHITEDIIEYLNENKNEYINKTTKEQLEEKLNEDLRIEDSVTWNASWSYTFNTYKARENLEGNSELVEEIVDEFWIDMKEHRNDPEYLDVSIRCYLLGQCIPEAIEERIEEQNLRTCDECWTLMNKWYCIHDGIEYYCWKDCLEGHYTEEEYIKMYDNDEAYRTEREPEKSLFYNTNKNESTTE